MFTFHQCFTNLKVEVKPASPSYIFIRHSHIAGSYRVFTTYAFTKASNFKKDLGSLIGMDINHEWHWHHVVEGTHLRSAFNEQQCNNLYNCHIPCVLMDHKEHSDFNRLLHTPSTSAVFNLPSEKNLLQGQHRQAYLYNLKKLYTATYSHDKVLQKVALNILEQM